MCAQGAGTSPLVPIASQQWLSTSPDAKGSVKKKELTDPISLTMHLKQNHKEMKISVKRTLATQQQVSLPRENGEFTARHATKEDNLML